MATEFKQVGDYVGRFSGNRRAITGTDNSTPDSYFQFNVDDALFDANRTVHVRIEVDYYDQRTETFMLQYDALPSSKADGRFANGGTFKTAIFNLCDANFKNRDNGADFRISDNRDGAEFISAVRVIGLPSGPTIINGNDFGANPNDSLPDSDAIQAALDSSCSGDTIVFASPGSGAGYQGYLIDKTIFLTGMPAKHNLTFTSSDPVNHALLAATADLKGCVVRLYSRSRLSGDNPSNIDAIDFGNIDVDGGRNVRICAGADGASNGTGDNWGSWLPRECSDANDPWCNPGNIAMDGVMDQSDVTQDYQANPARWTTGIILHDRVDSQAECGSALTFGGAAGTIRNMTIDTAGDHVHGAGCAHPDADGDQYGWADGITLMGTAQTVTDNSIINPTDVGIVYFGVKNTEISNNTITRQGDSGCGGIHAGITIGPRMWGGARVPYATRAVFGNSASCEVEPSIADVAVCTSANCQLWAYLGAGGTRTLSNNTVAGAHINYLIEGLDVPGRFIDQDNTSITPRLSDWQAATAGCNGVRWGVLIKWPTTRPYRSIPIC